ncbi:DUF2213 domain-containing protein [Cupriavidus pauculus]|uniref:DUF2213 domain-containing protein n=1 Tax=Cupriavidus pauculus TaxID=82633 RepID=UPI000C79525A|nr:DUF2213 domain-containing protein [Cupriavidus pauculus]
MRTVDDLKDVSLTWPDLITLGPQPDVCEERGWVLFKACRIATMGPNEWVCIESESGFPEGTEQYDLAQYDEAALESAHGTPFLIGHDNQGDVEAAHGFVVGPAYKDGDWIVLDIVVTSREALGYIAAGTHAISVCSTHTINLVDGVLHVVFTHKVCHVAMVDRPNVPGARLGGAELWTPSAALLGLLEAA